MPLASVTANPETQRQTVKYALFHPNGTHHTLAESIGLFRRLRGFSVGLAGAFVEPWTDIRFRRGLIAKTQGATLRKRSLMRGGSIS